MPKAIGEFFNELAIKAGIPVDDENLKAVLAAPELINVKVSDDLITAMDKGLLNIDAAKNNHPDIKKKYFADAFDGIDKFVNTLIDEDTFSADDITEIHNQKSTTKKIELVTAKLKAAKASAKPEDKTAINKQIADLNELVRIAKADKESTVKEYEGKIKNIEKKAALNSMFGNYKTIYDELPPGVKTTSLDAIITQALQDNGWELKTDDNGALQLLTKDGNNAFGSDHRQLTPQSFIDKTLAPILKVSTTPKGQNGVTPPVVPGSPNGAASTSFKEHTEKVIAEMANTMDSMM